MSRRPSSTPRYTINAESRLLTQTAASRPKHHEGVKPLVVARIPTMFPESSPAPSTRYDSPSVRSSTPSRRQAYLRDFEGSQVLSCLRPEHDASFSAVAHVQHGSPNTDADELADAAPPPRAGSPPKPTVGGIRKYSRANEHAKNIIYPDEAPRTQEMRQLWSAKALSDGSHIMLMKKRVDPPAHEDPPQHCKRVIAPAGNVEGAGVQVVSEEKPHVNHKRNMYVEPSNPKLLHRETSEHTEFKRQLNCVGLMGFAPTGRKRIENPDAGNLWEHRVEGWNVPQEKRGVKDAGKHSGSVVVWDLTRYTPDQLHEKPYKPLAAPLDGPPAFFAPPPPVRGFSPTKRRFADPAASCIFAGMEHPHTRDAVQPRGRSVGRYSPLRQHPPSHGQN